MNSNNYRSQSKFDESNHIQGSITINSFQYSAMDIITAIERQGLILNQVGSNIQIGKSTISPKLNQTSDKVLDSISLEVLQGLTGQIQRIFSELGKLKDHIGINPEFQKEFTINSSNSDLTNVFQPDVTRTSPSQNINEKWSQFGSGKLIEMDPKIRPSHNKKNSFNTQKDVPIITLGMKKDKNQNSPSIIDEFKDLTSLQGISDDEALDNISSKLFNSANEFLTQTTQKSNLYNVLQPDKEKQSQFVEDNSEGPYSPRCQKCNMMIQQQAKFCSKCGNKSF